MRPFCAAVAYMEPRDGLYGKAIFFLPLKPNAAQRAIVALPGAPWVSRESRPTLAKCRQRRRQPVRVVNSAAHAAWVQIAKEVDFAMAGFEFAGAAELLVNARYQ